MDLDFGLGFGTGLGLDNYFVSGPCEEKEVLAIESERNPECSVLSTSLSKTASQESQEDQRASGTVIEFSQDRACHKEWNVSVNGSCYPLLEQAGGMFYNEMLCCAI